MSDEAASKEDRIRKIRAARIREARAREAMTLDRPEPRKAVGDSAFLGLGQGVTLNFGDEVSAALGAAKDVAAAQLGLRGDIDFADAYQSYLPHVRSLHKDAEEDNPVAFGAGNIAGGIATAVLPGANVGAGVAKAFPALARKLPSLAAATVPGKNIGNIASTAGRLKAAAGLGALAGAGSTEANPLASPEMAKEFAKDTLLGAGIGALGQGAGELAPKAVSAAMSVSSKLRNVAEQKAFKATAGGVAKAYKETSEAKRGQIGRELLDSKSIGFGSSADSVLEKVSDAKSDVWARMEGIFSEIDQVDPETVSGRDIGARLLEYADKIDMPGNEAVVERMKSIAGKYINMGNMSLKRAQELKNNYKWSGGQSPTDLALGKQALNEIKLSIGNAMEDGVGRFVAAADEVPMMATGTGSVSDVSFPGPGGSVLKEATAARPDLGAEYESLRKRYGSLAAAEKYAREVSNREAKNRSVSLTDNILAAGAFAQGGEAGQAAMQGVAAGGLNKLFRERGNAALSVTADKIADILERTPEQLGDFAVALATSANKGPAALASTHAALLNDPGYRNTVGGIQLSDDAAQTEAARKRLMDRQHAQKWKATPEGQAWSAAIKASHPVTGAAIDQALSDVDPSETEVIIKDPMVIKARLGEIQRDQKMSSIEKASAMSAINETKEVRVKVPPRVTAQVEPGPPAGRTPEDLLRILGG